MRKMLRILKAITKRLNVYFNLKLNESVYKKKIKVDIYKSGIHNKLNSKQKFDIIAYYNSFGLKLSSTNWHEHYSNISNKFSVKYIPEDLFFTKIEPTLNDRLMFPALEDKNLTEKILEKFNQPKTLLKYINGFFIKENRIISKDKAIDILKTNDRKEYILKQSQLGYGGKGIIVFKLENNLKTNYNNMNLQELISSQKHDFIIQELVEQNIELKSLNQTSLNTLRITSYLRKEDTEILSCVLRVGPEGSLIDNMSQGGYLKIIEKDGTIRNQNITTHGKKIFSNHITFEKIPSFDKVKAFIRKMHPHLPYFKLISWDIAIDKNNEPILIEFNAFGQSIHIIQFNGPLFGEFTDEILNIISNK